MTEAGSGDKTKTIYELYETRRLADKIRKLVFVLLIHLEIASILQSQMN